MSKTAVVLLNLGGPDALSAVKPFLFNLFSDRAIIGLPQPFRFLLAKLISSRREKTAQAIYAQMGGKSPILELTQAQAKALEQRLGDGYKTFIAMRYWNPMTAEVVRQVKEYAPQRIVLLPLYPQFSTTTTGSSFALWEKEAALQKLAVPTQRLCCYPQEAGFIEAHVALIREQLATMASTPRLLFSAHGLPEKIIARGDPYQWQVEQTVASIMQKLGSELEHQICYQSRVGPLKWIGPSTVEALERAGQEKKPVLVVPVAFVSEHSETLVELDIEYKHVAEGFGVPEYGRVPALGTGSSYIEALAGLCVDASKPAGIRSNTCARLCPPSFSQCPCQVAP